MSKLICIECKGKEPGGRIDEDEVRIWLRKVAVMRAWLSAHPHYREADHCFELWASATFTIEALALLNDEKTKRLNAPIDWKDGEAILAMAATGKEKAMVDAFRQHFMHHPLAEIALEAREANVPALIPVSVADVQKQTGPGAFGSPLSLPAPASLFDSVTMD